MSKIEIRLKNYKGLEDEFFVLEKGFLWLIKGKGNEFKTSRLRGFEAMLLAKDNTPDPIRYGETEAITSIKKWIGPEGQNVEVERHIIAGKDSYRMKIDGKKVNKVATYRDMFGYIKFDAIDFIKKGTHQKGRDEQRDIILDLLSIENKEKFFDYEDKEEKLVETRKDNNKEYVKAKTLKEENLLSDTDLELLSTEERSKEEINKLRKEISDNDLIKIKKEQKKEFIESFSESLNSAKKGLEEEFIEKLEEVRLLVVNKKQEELDKMPNVDEESLKKKKLRLEKGEKVLNTIRDLKISKEKYNDYVKDFERLEKQKKIDEENVIKIREEKNTFMESIELPVKNLIIGSREEGLKYRHEGKIFAFNEDQLSKTLIYEITIQIMANINEKSGVIVLGDAGHFDTEFKKKIAKFAKEKDLLILADEVTDDKEVSIEIFNAEDNEKKVENKVKKITKKSDIKNTEIKKDEKDSNNKKDEQKSLYF